MEEEEGKEVGVRMPRKAWRGPPGARGGQQRRKLGGGG